MRAMRSGLSQRLVTVDLNGDSVRDLIAGAIDGTLIGGYSVDVTGLTMLATHTFDAGVKPFAVWSTLPSVAVGRSDGFLTVYDNGIHPTNDDQASKRPGLRLGGYYANGGDRQLLTTPRVASLDSLGKDAILVPDSRRSLLRLDAAFAGMTVPPKQVWARSHTYVSTIIPGKSGSEPGIVCFGQVEPVTSEPDYYIAWLRPYGTTRWQQLVEKAPINDPIPGDFDLDGVPDVVFEWGSPTDLLLHTRGLSGASGATIWNGPAIDPGAGRSPYGNSVVDWNSDGVDDVVDIAPGLRVLSGVNGEVLGTGNDTFFYFMPTLFDVDGDGVDEITLHGGYYPARTLSHDLNTALWIGDDDRPYLYGAIASCPQVPILVGGSLAHPSRLKMTPLSGASAGKYSTVVLAGGKLFPNEDSAEAAGAPMGPLTATTVHSNLTGKGRPSALVGSSDGWLYAVDPCTGQLDWSLGFGAAVGEAVYGDVDGDGIDEVLVSAADGYLYGVRNKAIYPPAAVRDILVAEAPDGQDIDSAALGTKMGCAWSTVVGATGYQVAFVADGVGYLTSPPWRDVGTALWLGFDSGITLGGGQRYRCSVRAVSSTGDPSPDVPSDGFVLAEESDSGTDAEASESGAEAGETGAGGADAKTDGALDAGPQSPQDRGEVLGGGCTCMAGSSNPRARLHAAILTLLALASLRRATKQVRN